LDPNAICEDQQTVGAADLVLDGVLVIGGVGVLDQSRQLEMESLGNLAGVDFTFVGTNAAGQVVTETVIGPNAGVQATVRDDWATITQISVDGAVGTDVEIGTNGVGGSQVVPLDRSVTPFNVSLFVDITGTVNATAQFTFDPILEEGQVGPFVWSDHVDLTAVVADADGTFISPVTACRLLTNSGVGTAILRIIQAGIV
jgi:hypothetical protein